METTGQKIRKLRLNKGLSQEELAYKIGVARQTVSNWELDAKLPTTDNIIALSDFFNVGFEYFFYNDNHSKPVANEAATADGASKKNSIILIISVILCSSILVFSLFLGSIFTFLALQPKNGYDLSNKTEFDLGGIICFFIALLALVCLIILLIIIFKKRKSGIQNADDKMTSQNGRQN